MPAKKITSRQADASSSTSSSSAAPAPVDLLAGGASAPALAPLSGEITSATVAAFPISASSLLEGGEGAAVEDAVEFDDEAVLNASGSTYGGRWSRDEDLALRRGVEILGVSVSSFLRFA